jgi:beta-mannosidase
MEQLRSKQELKTGWQLKQQDDPKEEWLPVKKIPSQVHVDLLANEKYVPLL